MKDLKGMSRREKFKYLKYKGVKCLATMKNVELDRLLDELEQGKPAEEVGPKSIRDGRKRTPLGQFRAKLSTDGLDIPADKVARWVNDKPGRVRQAQEGGYQLVRDPNKDDSLVGEDPLRAQGLGDSVSAIVGETEGGQPMLAYLMVIDKDLYDEDQAEKQKPLDDMDAAIRRGAVEPGEGQYVPTAGIKYETTKD